MKREVKSSSSSAGLKHLAVPFDHILFHDFQGVVGDAGQRTCTKVSLNAITCIGPPHILGFASIES
jgi:hypothetical protein